MGGHSAAESVQLIIRWQRADKSADGSCGERARQTREPDEPLMEEEVLRVEVVDEDIQQLVLGGFWLFIEVTRGTAGNPILVRIPQIDPLDFLGILERLLALGLCLGRGFVSASDLARVKCRGAM